MLLLIVMGIFVIIIICIAAAGSSNHFTGLHFLTYASYVKLGITIVSYMTWMNHQRTNTEQLSIEIVLLDFAGGSLSMLQLSWESYNLTLELIQLKYNILLKLRRMDPKYTLIENVRSIGFFDIISNDDAPLSDLEEAVDSWQKHVSDQVEELTPSSLDEGEE